VLLDSTFLHDLVRGEADADARLDELIAAGAPVAISALTVFEVGVGLRGAGEQYRDRFAAVVDELDVVAFEIAAAWRALRIQRDLYDAGEAIGTVDVLIAGTALERTDQRILTRNTDEFGRVDGLSVETY
jgi:predicted nucleic acid-binding protein